MRAGQLRHRLTVQRLGTPQDYDLAGAPLGQQSGSGAPLDVWVTVADRRWASLQPLDGTERFVAQQERAEGTVIVRMRYDPTVTVRERDRLLLDGRIFDVQSAIDLDERKTEVRLLVKEVKP